MAQGPLPDLGSIRMGRPVPHRTGPARRRLSAQLDFVPDALARRLDPADGLALVLRAHPLYGGAVLLPALPGPEAQPGGLPARRHGLRHYWLDGLDRVAANAEWRGVGSADIPFLIARC